MFSNLFTRIYFALTRFKQHTKSLSNDTSQEGDWVASVWLEFEEVEGFLRTIQQLVDSGFAEEEVQIIHSMINRVRNHDRTFLDFNVFYNEELAGLRIALTVHETREIELHFITEKALAEEIQGSYELFSDTTEHMWH